MSDERSYVPKHAAPDDTGDGRRRRPWLVAVVVAFWLVLVALTHLVAAVFVVPSASMERTLMPGNRIVVDVHDHDYRRGDVVVFADPGGWDAPDAGVSGLFNKVSQVALLHKPQGHLVKRIVGVAGDTVACAGPGNDLTVNQVPISEPYVNGQACQAPFTVKVPSGSLWVMGDNRADSADSRMHGPVPVSAVTGRVASIVWPVGRHADLSDLQAFVAVH